MNIIMEQIFQENQYMREDRHALKAALDNYEIYILQKIEEYKNLLIRAEKQEYEPPDIPLLIKFEDDDELENIDPAEAFNQDKAEHIAWLEEIIRNLKKDLEANNKARGKLLIHQAEPEMFGELK